MTATPQPRAARFAPLNRELAATQRNRERNRPDLLPVGFYIISDDLLARADFLPAMPARGDVLLPEFNRIKLRGLGLADALILRLAIASGVIDPRAVFLAPQIPTPLPLDQGAAPPHIAVTVDAPLLPDFIGGDPIHGGDPDRNRDNRPDRIRQTLGTHEGDRLTTPTAQVRSNPNTGDGANELAILATHVPRFIWEIKPAAGHAALGQVLAYAHAWNHAFGPSFPLAPAILTDRPRPYLHSLATAHGVELHSLGQTVINPPSFPT